jgi:hypothetical protein
MNLPSQPMNQRKCRAIENDLAHETASRLRTLPSEAKLAYIRLDRQTPCPPHCLTILKRLLVLYTLSCRYVLSWLMLRGW